MNIAQGQPKVDVAILIDSVSRKTELRCQERLKRTTEVTQHQSILVYEGVLSVEALLDKGQRQILDFFLPRDIVCMYPLMIHPKISIRAITKTSLLNLDDNTEGQLVRQPELYDLLMTQRQTQLSRAYIHQFMIGYLDGEARVVSFLFALAMRGSSPRSCVVLDVPMSRDDVADYLAMNRDTLSRIFARLESSGLIERMNRHAIRIGDLDEIARRTPIAKLISAACIPRQSWAYVHQLMSRHAGRETNCCVSSHASVEQRPGATQGIGNLDLRTA